MIQTHDKRINAYFDESRIDNPESAFMVFGGLFMERKYVSEVRTGIRAILKEHDYQSEIKWVKTDPRRLEVYQKIIDYVLELPPEKLAFNCIVVDKTRVEINKYHDGDKELAFYKFVYQLLKKRIHSNTCYNLVFDFKPNKSKDRLKILKGFLDAFIYVEHADSSVIKHLQGYESKENVLLQVADLFTGAVAYAYNSSDDNEQPKTLLAKYIASKLNEDGLKFKSLPSEKKFNIFAIDLKKRG